MGELIRPFCIMLLYRYLLHYGLLLRIMSQYLCLFSLILQGLHKEGESRQLEFWVGKGANIRDIFCTTPKVLKLHGSQFQNIYKILAKKVTEGGHPPSTRVGGALPPWARPLPHGPPNGPLMPIFGYMESFVKEKNHKQACETKLRRHEEEPWRNQACASATRSSRSASALSTTAILDLALSRRAR